MYIDLKSLVEVLFRPQRAPQVGSRATNLRLGLSLSATVPFICQIELCLPNYLLELISVVAGPRKLNIYATIPQCSIATYCRP
jgi:hypothetical protein